MVVGEPETNNETRERVRALLRTGMFRDARTFLSQLSDAWALTENARLTFFLDNDLAAAGDLALRAREVATSEGDRAIAYALYTCIAASRGGEERVDMSILANVGIDSVPEIIYYAAFAAYIRHELVLASSWLKSHAPSSTATEARFLLLRAYVASAQGQFREHLTLASRALDLLEEGAPEERYLISSAAMAFATAVREVPFSSGVARLEAAHRRLSADEGFIGSRFHVARAIATLHALHGNHDEARRYVIRAATDATRPVERMYAHLDHASLAIMAGDQYSASVRAAFALATEQADTFPWSSLGTDEVVLLPIAAQVAAELGDSARAIAYCERASGLERNIPPRFSVAHNGLFEMFVDEAAAFAFRDHNRDVAIDSAGAAYEALVRNDYSWRAGRMAILLHSLSRNRAWLDRATEHLQDYPRSPFHRFLEAGSRRRILSPREHQILDHLRRGLTTREIAAALDISPNTVRTYLSKLYKFYGTKSRQQLIVKLA